MNNIIDIETKIKQSTNLIRNIDLLVQKSIENNEVFRILETSLEKVGKKHNYEEAVDTALKLFNEGLNISESLKASYILALRGEDYMKDYIEFEIKQNDKYNPAIHTELIK